MIKLPAPVTLVILATTFCLAQDAAPDPVAKPAFEVVSIRPGSGKPTVFPSGIRVIGGVQGGPGSPDPERYGGNSVALRGLIQTAYGMKRDQVSGPGWIDTTRYDISAKVPAGATREQFNLMLQTMLAERFNMKFHREIKSFPAFNLIVAKSGLKLKENVSIDACSSWRPSGEWYMSTGGKPDIRYRQVHRQSWGNPDEPGGGRAHHYRARRNSFLARGNAGGAIPRIGGSR